MNIPATIENERDIQGLSYESHLLAHCGEEIHLQRIFTQPNGPVVLMLHGSLGNSRVFYSENGKGLAPYLARQGYDVYCLDLRGRGKSRPRIDRSSEYGQTESIVEEIPLALRYLQEFRGNTEIRCCAHSWGGVLFLSTFIRFPDLAKKVRGAVFFGSKRVIHRNTFLKRFALTPVWDGLGRLLVHFKGYLSGKWIRFGDDCETKKSYFQTAAWLWGKPWVDSEDGFDYRQRLGDMPHFPCLFLTGTHDWVAGAADDIKAFISECGDRTETQLRVLGRKTGFSRDYGHLDILIHPQAQTEVFPLVLEALQGS